MSLSKKPSAKDSSRKFEAVTHKSLEAETNARYLPYDETEIQMEQAIERANLMVTEAEISNLEFSQIFNTLNDAIWVIDKKFSVMRINKALADLVGEKQSDIVGKKCFEVFQNAICSEDVCPMKEVIKKRRSTEMDITIRNGSESDAFFYLRQHRLWDWKENPLVSSPY